MPSWEHTAPAAAAHSRLILSNQGAAGPLQRGAVPWQGVIVLAWFDWVLVEAVHMPDLPARLVNGLEVCWSLACQGPQVHSWVTVPAKRWW